MGGEFGQESSLGRSRSEVEVKRRNLPSLTIPDRNLIPLVILLSHLSVLNRSSHVSITLLVTLIIFFKATMATDFVYQQLEQKQIFEDIQIARRKAHEQLALLDEKERKLHMGPNKQDVDRLSNGFNRISLNGPVSEPTTPPDYPEDVFSTRYSRSGRVSLSNVASPPGLMRRTSQASSKVTSPPNNRSSNPGLYSTHRQSTKSMPGSRRGSDEEEDYLEQLPTNRSAAT